MSHFILYRISMGYQLAFLYFFLPLRKNKGWVVFSLVVSYLLTSFLDYLNFCGNFDTIPVINTMAQTLLLLGTAFMISRYKDWRVVFTTLCSSNFVLIGNLVISSLRIFGMDFYKAALCGILVHSLVFFIEIHLIQKYYLIEMETMHRNWRNLCILPLLFYLVVYGMAVWPAKLSEHPQNCISLFLVLLLMCVCYGLIVRDDLKLHGEEEKIKQISVMEKYTEGVLHEAESIRKIRQEIAIQRHDLRHSYAMILSYLSEEKYHLIADLIRESNHELDLMKTRETHCCENILVNGIVGNFVEKAKNEKITFDYRLDVPSDFDNITDFGFATMLSNLLDNAFGAVLEIPDINRRNVSIRIQPRKEQLIVEVRNTYQGNLEISGKTGLPLSKKGEGHGYGMVSVANYAKKSGALLKFKKEDQQVVVQFISNRSC